MNNIEAIRHYDETAIWYTAERGNCALDLTAVVDRICHRFYPEQSRGNLQWSLIIPCDIRSCLRIEQKRHPRNAGRHFLEHFHPFADHCGFEIGKSGDISARMRHVRNKASPDRIGYLNKHKWYAIGLSTQGED